MNNRVALLQNDILFISSSHLTVEIELVKIKVAILGDTQ